MLNRFTVPAKGIGRKDHSTAVQRSTATLITPTLRQRVFAAYHTGVLATPPFPLIYRFIFPLPQEDGGWDWEASSIITHFTVMGLSLQSNHLVNLALLRYNSFADFMAGIVAEVFPQVYGYGEVTINYTKGIPTQPGSAYAVMIGFYSTRADEYVRMHLNGICSDLTIPWMQWT